MERPSSLLSRGGDEPRSPRRRAVAWHHATGAGRCRAPADASDARQRFAGGDPWLQLADSADTRRLHWKLAHLQDVRDAPCPYCASTPRVEAHAAASAVSGEMSKGTVVVGAGASRETVEQRRGRGALIVIGAVGLILLSACTTDQGRSGEDRRLAGRGLSHGEEATIGAYLQQADDL